MRARGIVEDPNEELSELDARVSLRVHDGEGSLPEVRPVQGEQVEELVQVNPAVGEEAPLKCGSAAAEEQRTGRSTELMLRSGSRSSVCLRSAAGGERPGCGDRLEFALLSL